MASKGLRSVAVYSALFLSLIPCMQAYGGCEERPYNTEVPGKVDFGCGEGDCISSTQSARLEISRVIGNGGLDVVTAAGEPQNFGSIVSKGLIEAQGCIQVEVGSGADADISFRISINGVPQEFIFSRRRESRKYSFEIRLDNFKFGVRREGRDPRPGVNVITARTSVISGVVL